MIIPPDVRNREWAFCACNVTGKQPASLEEECMKAGLHFVDVYSADLQEIWMEHRKHRHHVGDYKEAYTILCNAYGKPPLIYLGNPVCHYNTYLCPENHAKLGTLTAKDKERIENKIQWLKNKYDMLNTSGCPVIITENPKGYADKVITRANDERAYVAVQPWQFYGFDGKFDPEDLHAKETHLFSAGNSDAIDKLPLDSYIVTRDEPPDVVHDWVLKQKDSNARSVVPTGEAAAISKCAVDRYKHACKDTTPKALVPLVFNEDEIHSMKAAKRQCNSFVGMRNGEKCYCNLPFGHDNERNRKRGVAECALYDYETREILFAAPIPRSRRASRGPQDAAAVSSASCGAVQSPTQPPPPSSPAPSDDMAGTNGQPATDAEVGATAALLELSESTTAAPPSMLSTEPLAQAPVLATRVVPRPMSRVRVIPGVALPSAVCKLPVITRSGKQMRRYKPSALLATRSGNQIRRFKRQ